MRHQGHGSDLCRFTVVAKVQADTGDQVECILGCDEIVAFLGKLFVAFHGDTGDTGVDLIAANVGPAGVVEVAVEDVERETQADGEVSAGLARGEIGEIRVLFDFGGSKRHYEFCMLMMCSWVRARYEAVDIVDFVRA